MNMTLTSAKTALEQISTMSFPENDGTMSSSDALSLVVDLALNTLNPHAKPSASELKAQEITQFVMGNFGLAFATNDDIAAALNTASITTPQGKEWTRGNISKVMIAVRENIVKEIQGSATVEAVSDDAETVGLQQPMKTVAEMPNDSTAKISEVVEAAPAVDDDLEELMSDLDNLEVPS